MTDDATEAETDWEAFMEDANEQFLEAFERNVEAQATFVETWMDALEDATSDEHIEEGIKGYAKAYQAWMDAAAEQVERVSAMLDGEDISVEAVRNQWLNAANEAFKEVMSTTAFAATTGDTVETALDLKQEADEYAEDTLHTLGFATVGDVEEVGERLIELERRQQAIEERLDEILDHMES